MGMLVKPDPAHKVALSRSCRTSAGMPKRAYPTRGKAVRALRDMRTQGRGAKTTEAYRCPYCRCWHLGNTT